MPDQLDMPLSDEEFLQSADERKIMLAALTAFGRSFPSDKIFNRRWAHLSTERRIALIDWTEYRKARRWLTDPTILKLYIRLKMCP